ncbi:MAG: hypothetical protein E7645_01940 [Ruminococcaceae bacterium]|nr:hypothetical protein [Oscillospiraceae bacterium]
MTYDDLTGYLYTTAVPVLLDGKVTAGRLASEMHLRHDIRPHWFGRGFDIRLLLSALRHPLPSALSRMSDGVLLQILLDFAATQSGILLLYPCSPEAEAFVGRNTEVLESRYVILHAPAVGDPLAPLVRCNR